MIHWIIQSTAADRLELVAVSEAPDRGLNTAGVEAPGKPDALHNLKDNSSIFMQLKA